MISYHIISYDISCMISYYDITKKICVVHKVRDVILLGWSEIFGHPGPGHGHVNNIKRLACCVNNKEMYLTVLRAHARAGHLSYLCSLEVDLADAAGAEDYASEEEDHQPCAKLDFTVEMCSSELGIRYPVLQAIFGGKRTRQRIQVQAYHI